MGGQRRGAAATGSRRAAAGERKQGSGQKSASATRRSTKHTPGESTPKVRKTAPRKVDPNYNAGALAEEISAIVEVAVPPAASQAYAELEREANSILADSTPTVQSAAVRARSQRQSAPPDSPAASSPESSSAQSSRKHRTLSSMSGAWNRAELRSAFAPDTSDETETLETPESQTEQTSMETRPVQAVSAPMRPRVASQNHSRRYWANVSGSIVGHHHPLPEADLVVPTAAVHAALAVVAAGAGAVFALLEQSQLAITILLLTGILGLGAALAYSFAETFSNTRVAGSILIVSQLGALLWSFLLIGYRPSLLLLIPGLVILAMRMVGQLAGLCMAAGAALLYCLSAWASFNGYFQPRLPLDSGALLFIDTVVVLAGITFLTWMLLDLRESQARALTFARAKRYEAATLRDQIAALRRDVEDDAEQIELALVTALSGEEVAQTTLRSVFSPLGEAVRALAERIQTLQRDREDRLRLEGALRRVILAAQRKRLGLPWTWPEPSGTLADELVAALPAPPTSLADGSLEKELDSLGQVSAFDVEELPARPRVPSWPQPASQRLATLMRSRKRPAYLRPVVSLEDADTPTPLPIELGEDEAFVQQTWDTAEP